MRKTYRAGGVKDYWNARWSDIPVDGAMTNTSAYPLKYALETVKSAEGLILEAGCGSGGNLWMIAQEGFNTYGLDFSKESIKVVKNLI